MYDLKDLLYLMSRLRDPQTGCPWDLKQSFQSIVPHTLEEAYEVVDAIERGDKTELRDELGDLLFQVVFYAQLGKEEQSFEFQDVVDGIVQKLLRRHPHVFPDQALYASHPEGTRFSDAEIKQQWEQIKAQERDAKKQASSTRDEAFDAQRDSVLSDIPRSFPPLLHAEKLQKRASQHGFDWQSIPPVLAKLEEEIAELKAEMELAKTGVTDPDTMQQRLQDELGDVIFSCVNLARFLKLSPDQALAASNEKFIRRFQYIEQYLASQGQVLDEQDLERLDHLWHQAKAHEAS